MRRRLAGSMALDTSALLELVFSTPPGLRLKEALLEERVIGHTSEFNLFELEYVLCRRLGWGEASRRVRALADSGYVVVHETRRLADAAALLKCKHSIAAGDCFTLAVARRIEGPALFARRERELAEALERGGLGVEVLFLEELA
jgi:predicted nucleic acid-binding protein